MVRQEPKPDRVGGRRARRNCIAGDEQHLQVGPKLAAGLGDLAAVHAFGQTNVGDQEMDPGG
jgi:hypothetical protein